jgi:amino acid adenylation domain-containing protein
MSSLHERIAHLSPERRELLLRMLGEPATPRGPTAVPARARTGEPLPLSFPQRRLWFLQQLEPASSAYNICRRFTFVGPLRVEALTASLEELVRRHEALRTRFLAARPEPVQAIDAPSPPALPLEDLSALPPAARAERLRELSTEEAHRPFELTRGPLMRTRLVRLAAGEHALLLTLHHTIADGWSLGILQRELVALYGALCEGRLSPLPPPSRQCADHALWQREEARSAAFEEHLAYWRRELAGAPAALSLPADRTRPAQPSSRGAVCSRTLPPALVRAVRERARSEGVTPFVLLLAAFQALLSRLTGEGDVVVGVPVSNRGRAELEGVVGCLANTLALRARPSGGLSFRQLVRRAHEASIEALAHQEVPFEQVVEAVRPERHLARSPLFQVLFSLDRREPEDVAVAPGLRLRRETVDTHAAAFDLSLLLEEGPEDLRVDAEYATELFEPATLEGWLGCFERLLEGAVAHPDTQLASLPLLAPEEHARLLEQARGPRQAVEHGACLHHLFERRAALTPDAVALEGDSQRLTWRELDERANHLAHALRARGVGPEARVGLYLERSVELAIGLLGVLKAGGAYVPLDPTHPAERLAFLEADARVAVRVTRPAWVERLPAGAPVLLVPSSGEREPRPPPTPGLAPEHLAYVMYTSGSTGRPKGVQVPHRALVNLAGVMAARYGLGPTDRVLQFASPGFDVAAEELFPTWYAGATAVVWPQAGAESMEDFTRAVDAAGLTVLNLPSPFWHAWLPALGAPGLRFPAALRLLIVGSDQVAPGDVERWRALAPEPVRLIAAYGVTEATVTATLHDVEADATLDRGRPVPIGRPLANGEAYLLDARLQPVPAGVVGELYLGGAGLARGYLGRPDLTAERFVPHPFSGESGARLYRTGDLARRRSDGALEFLGRVDAQVKLRGYRIEPGEIEAALAEHPSLRACAVAVREDTAGEKRLVAYVVPASGEAAPSEPALREHLSTRLPPHLLPARYVVLEALPLSPSGKLDRRALPAPGAPAASTRTYTPPRTLEEARLAGLWAEVLGVERPGVLDDFFELGGHSLLATQLISRVRESCGVELPLRALFEAPTVAGLSERVLRARSEAPVASPPPILPAPRDGALPLSFAQERMWLLEQLQPGGARYAVPYAVRLRGPVDAAVLERCVEELVARHEALRTTFPTVEGSPRQVVAPPPRVPLRVLDWRERPDGDRAAEAFITEEASRPFALDTGPLLRAFLLRLAGEASVLLLSLHHIVVDGASLEVLERELRVLYAAFSRGAPSPLPPPTLQAADYAVWQRAWHQGAAMERQLAYWREQLAGAPAVLELPSDRPRPAVRSFAGEFQARQLGHAPLDAVRALGRREGATPFMVLLAAWQALLGRLTGQDDFVVGTITAGRTRAETEGLVGCFVNTLALRARLAGAGGFRALLTRVREDCLAAFAHQELPFERLVDALQPERVPGVNPLFQVTFSHHPPVAAPAGGLTLEPLEVRTGAAKFDLTLATSELPEGLQVVLEYATDLFEPDTVARVLDGFQVLLEGALASPDAPLHALPLLSEAERGRLLVEWNDTAADFPRERPVHALFEQCAARTPQATALVLGEARLDYRELDARANQLAWHLRALGVGPEARVGLCLERSLELGVAMLGVLKAGGAYVPLDPTLPPERLAFMAEDARLHVLVTHRGLQERLPGFQGARVCLDTDREALASRPERAPPSLTAPDNAAYVIYTSGSTGRPKGVVVPHAGLTHVITFSVRRLGLGGEDRWLQVASAGFDASVVEVFTVLTAGATLELLPPEAVGSGPELARLLRTRGITACFMPPSLLEVVPEGEYPRLRTLFVGGEASSPGLVARWAPGRRFYNAYGPTEVSIYATLHEHTESDGAALPLGRPIANARVYVLDRHLRPVPVGVTGELYLGGAGLARGYLHRPDLTAERFLADPFSAEPGARMYRTGDLARHRPDGTLEFRGRVDTQVKLRGYRIELGEIEAALAEHPRVREAVVLLREDAPGVRYLAAYVVRDAAPAGATEDDAEALRRHLQRRLPAYMVPTSLVLLDAFPLTANGKVDRRALPIPERAGSQGRARVPPRTTVERTVAEVWAEVLGLPAASLHIEDDFFALGGNSLLATRAMARLRERYGVELPVRALFESSTLAALADALVAREFEGVDAEALAALLTDLAPSSEPDRR